MYEDPFEPGINDLDSRIRHMRNIENQNAEKAERRGRRESYGGSSDDESIVTAIMEMFRFRSLLIWAAIDALIYFSGWWGGLSGHGAVQDTSAFCITIAVVTGIGITSPTARKLVWEKIVLGCAMAFFIGVIGLVLWGIGAFVNAHPLPQTQAVHHTAVTKHHKKDK